LGHCDTDT